MEGRDAQLSEIMEPRNLRQILNECALRRRERWVWVERMTVTVQEIIDEIKLLQYADCHSQVDGFLRSCYKQMDTPAVSD